MYVSENSGTPKSSILIGFSIINHPFWRTTIFGNIQIFLIISTLYPKHRNPMKTTMSFLIGGDSPSFWEPRSRGSTWARRWFLCWIVYHRVHESTRCRCRERRLDFFWFLLEGETTPIWKGGKGMRCLYVFVLGGRRGGNVIKVTCGQS